jgi:hypothetical protein
MPDYWINPELPDQRPACIRREDIDRLIDLATKAPARPDVIIVSADYSDLLQFTLMCCDRDKLTEDARAFVAFLSRLQRRARGRARFKTLLAYSREATEYDKPLQCPM